MAKEIMSLCITSLALRSLGPYIVCKENNHLRHENNERIKHTIPSKAQFKNHKEHYNERGNIDGSHPQFEISTANDLIEIRLMSRKNRTLV